jgi:hypothetical protein
MTRPRVHLFHWHEGEAAERAERLRRAGFDATFDFRAGSAIAARLRAHPLAALVIDLSRMPSHGREVAVYVRQTKSIRHLPIVFAGGDPGKVAAIRALIPDAVYCEWDGIAGAIGRAVERPPLHPVRPVPIMERYAAKPLPAKLGLRSGLTVWLLGAPDGFVEFVRAPEDVEFVTRYATAVSMAILFVRSLGALEFRLSALEPKLGLLKLWICWPKHAAGQAITDLSQPVVLAAARAHGLSTSKVLSLDRIWSGMLFSLRRTEN